MNYLSTLWGQINPQGGRKIMIRKDIKIQINTILWENAVKKIESDFGKKYAKTDCMLIIMLLALYKRKSKLRSKDNLYLAVNHPDQLAISTYKSMTIAVYDGCPFTKTLSHHFIPLLVQRTIQCRKQLLMLWIT